MGFVRNSKNKVMIPEEVAQGINVVFNPTPIEPEEEPEEIIMKKFFWDLCDDIYDKQKDN